MKQEKLPLNKIRIQDDGFPVVLGGLGIVINIDETTLNFKRKGPRG